MDNLKSINTLELTKNDGTTEQFREGDKVRIYLINCIPIEFSKNIFVGVIKYIDSDCVELDASEECRAIIINLKYKDIKSICKVR